MLAGKQKEKREAQSRTSPCEGVLCDLTAPSIAPPFTVLVTRQYYQIADWTLILEAFGDI